MNSTMFVLHRFIAWILTIGLLISALFVLATSQDIVLAIVLLVLADVYGMVIHHTIGFREE